MFQGILIEDSRVQFGWFIGRGGQTEKGRFGEEVRVKMASFGDGTGRGL